MMTFSKCHYWGLFPRYLLYALMDLYQIFDNSPSWDEEELISLVQKVKGHGYSMTKYAKNTIFMVCFCDISVSQGRSG